MEACIKDGKRSCDMNGEDLAGLWPEFHWRSWLHIGSQVDTLWPTKAPVPCVGGLCREIDQVQAFFEFIGDSSCRHLRTIYFNGALPSYAMQSSSINDSEEEGTCRLAMPLRIASDLACSVEQPSSVRRTDHKKQVCVAPPFSLCWVRIVSIAVSLCRLHTARSEQLGVYRRQDPRCGA
eukprot:6191067-Pleurochrysis_carterae.AAC.2